jgi:hypothetical protein
MTDLDPQHADMTAPNPLLVKKMTRMALGFLATDMYRPTLEGACLLELLDQLQVASPKVRRELLEEHMLALSWILRDACTLQTVEATFE